MMINVKIKNYPPVKIGKRIYSVMGSENEKSVSFKDKNGVLWSAYLNQEEYKKFLTGKLPIFNVVSEPECPMTITLSPKQSARFEAALKEQNKDTIKRSQTKSL